jgi:protein-S-isoprenylcysteine O-methyltransferase Ste14
MTTTKDSPGVVPPPLIVLGLIIAGLALDWAWPAPVFDGRAQAILGGALFAAGLGLVLPCVRLFRRAGTNVPTYQPTTALVTEGPYRFSRNPIYLGLALGYAGIAVMIDSAWLIVLVVALVAILDLAVIRREEAYLAAKFPDAYRSYQGRVRRWL